MRTDFISRIPKIDLHLHLEGSLPARTIARLAAAHRLPVPDPSRFEGFRGFLEAFGAICGLLVDERDFELAASDLFADLRRRKVVHVEVLFSPQIHMRRGVPLGSIMRGLLRARDRAVSKPGFSVVFIADGVRQWGGEWFEQVVRSLAPWAGRGLAGIGVGGDERACKPGRFAAAFRHARELGLHTTIHAGEAVGPSSVREAIMCLDVERVGHGFRAASDPDLVALLSRRGIALELCPTSNVATGLVPSLEAHPARALFDEGAPVTINTDDGAFFGTDIEEELRRVHTRMGFTREEIRQLLVRSARSAFVSGKARRRLERQINRAWEEAGTSTKGSSPGASSRQL